MIPFNKTTFNNNYKNRKIAIHYIIENRILCGKSQDKLSVPIKYTTDKLKVTCGNCKRCYGF